MPSLSDETAGTLQLELMDVSTCHDGNPAYGAFLAGPHDNYEALADVLLQLTGLAARIDYLRRDPEHCAPGDRQRAALETLGDAVRAARERLVHRAHDGLTLAPPRESVPDATVREWRDRVDALEHELAMRRPLRRGEPFRLRTTGENDLYLAGPYNKMGPRMDASLANAEQLRFDGQDPVIGADVRLHSRVGLGDHHIITATGSNRWLQYKSGTDDRHTWRIAAKRDGGDHYIRSGDRICLTNKKYQDRTIKAEQKNGVYWAKAKWYRKHWLLIERWEAPAAAVDRETVTDESE